jgi:formylglycine-generating enzyme
MSKPYLDTGLPEGEKLPSRGRLVVAALTAVVAIRCTGIGADQHVGAFLASASYAEGGGPTSVDPPSVAATDRGILGSGSDPYAWAQPVAHTDQCPAGTLEVQGRYCTDLLHRCISGGKTHLGEPTGEPEPYYCDGYQEGVARCLGPEEGKHFCIDEYEYPNQKGAIPMVMVSWYEAKRLCEGQGKRLCGDDEWTLACEGPERLPYTYGWQRDRTACNIDHRWIKPNDDILGNRHAAQATVQAEIDRLSQRVPSGSMPRCKSAYGVKDMGGNVDEWAVNVTLHGKPYQSIFKGGHWVGGARNRCRPVTARHDETTAYYAEGFRCCADAQ